MKRRKIPEAVSVADDRASRSSEAPPPNGHDDVARRAYDLYLARGCEHGHDVEDWLEAERQLHGAAV